MCENFDTGQTLAYSLLLLILFIPHLSSILHLDLKMENVLHDQHGVMKLTDFGLSAKIPTG